tara:strand:+ start:4737 stop:5054 length:318 start_codon:yes stop_codon:yes gene_type:complete
MSDEKDKKKKGSTTTKHKHKSGGEVEITKDASGEVTGKRYKGEAAIARLMDIDPSLTRADAMKQLGMKAYGGTMDMEKVKGGGGKHSVKKMADKRYAHGGIIQHD